MTSLCGLPSWKRVVVILDPFSAHFRADCLHGDPLFLHHRASDGDFLPVAAEDEPTAEPGREYLSMYSNLACRAVTSFLVA